jgi:predicted Zn-dependent peptidase
MFLSMRTAGCRVAARLLAAAVLVSAPAAAGGRDLPESVDGPGGSEVILDRYPGSGSVLVAVAVRAGSAWETPDTRGVTHFLEHMLFNGSERFSREEISGWVDDNGAFLNAFTRKEVTVYFLLARADLLEQSIEILSQMLLHPVFDAGEVEKERKVVLEEMNQGAGDPLETVSREADRYLYRGSSLTEPVIGYESTIAGVSREAIIGYYRSRYSPSNMRIFVTGDYDRGRALGWISDHFTVPGADLPEDPVTKPVLTPRWSGDITVRVVEGQDGRVELLIGMPSPGEKLFPAVLLLAEMLSAPSSPLKGEDAGALLAEAGLEEPSAGLEVHEEFAALRISAEVKKDMPADPAKLLEAVQSLAGWSPEAEEVERARMSFASSDMFDRERYHFYIMLNGQSMAVAGTKWDEAIRGVARTKAGQIARLTEKYLGEPMFNGFFASPVAADASLQRGESFFEELPGGLTAGVRQREGSPVEALCMLFPGRACAGPGELWGWGAAALHTLLENSAGGKGLEEELASLGARIQWGDIPFIPMDDYLVNPYWSFIRLETPAGAMDDAAALLAGFLGGYEITAEDTEAAAGVVAREYSIRSRQSSLALRNEVYPKLFAGHPWGWAQFASPRKFAEAGADAMGGLRRKLHNGTGSIVTMVSRRPVDESMDLLAGVFGDYPADMKPACPDLVPDIEVSLSEGESPGSSLQLAAAWRIDGLTNKQFAALAVAAEALSRRMQLDIRETQGLAYSTGCGMTRVASRAVVTARLGTRPENAEKAETALKANIEAFKADPPTVAETAAAKSRLVSRLSRRQLSSAGEALGIALDGLYRGGYDGLELITEVHPDEVSFMAGYLDPEKALLTRLRPAENGAEKKSMPNGMMGR